MSHRRIQMRAKLDTTAYPVDLAESLAEGLTLIRKEAPEVVILAHDLPGLRLRQFCKLMRSTPSTQGTTLVVAVQRENQSARVSALVDGAHDVIEMSAESADLRARMRSFMRLQQGSGLYLARSGAHIASGLSEPTVDFAPKTVACFVTGTLSAPMSAPDPADSGIEIRRVAAHVARREPHPDADVFVLWETQQTDEARETLAALLTHPVSQHSRILFVTDCAATGASPLDLGAHDQVPTTVSATELVLRIQRLARRRRDADRERRATTDLERKAYVDGLTGLNNRTAMEEYLARTDRALAEEPRALAVLIADIDHFKSINDNHGHSAGDMVLSRIAQIMKSSLRDGDFIARYGGEEFLIVLPDVRPGQARAVASRLRDAVAGGATAIENGTHVRATISIGIALRSRSERVSTMDLRRAADTALYEAKRNGRNRIEIAQAQSAQHGIPVASARAAF
ncbi:MAG: diguanylate cyclase [Marivita sp.]|uniref:GGDEF domain-containing response regulator n=1 Tax=Marivita sp. TaxID=2003365 RepID=UPI0025BFA06D|nr:diguanylate cyclase [Marivita sp.]MCI5111727.1 diguanylate cyclase [Marivita sp.]